MRDWITEFAAQVRNAVPVPLALVGEHAGLFTLDNTIKLMGGLYLLMQIGYLAWKWRKEHKHGLQTKG